MMSRGGGGEVPWVDNPRPDPAHPHLIFSPSQLDFWLAPRGTGDPVDVRVPFPSLQPLKAHLEANGIPYSIMIEDVQVSGGGGSGGRGSRHGGGRGLTLPRVPQALVDREQMQMLRRRRVLPLSTDAFDYSSYHNLDEVMSCGWESTRFGAFWGEKN